jgi:hypothetical protein
MLIRKAERGQASDDVARRRRHVGALPDTLEPGNDLIEFRHPPVGVTRIGGQQAQSSR